MKFFPWFRKKPPVIHTQWGPTTEWARAQSAANVRDNPEVRERVEQAMIEKFNGDVKGAYAELKRIYPEAYGG